VPPQKIEQDAYVRLGRCVWEVGRSGEEAVRSGEDAVRRW
jgi:hypothetical protein